MLTATAITKHYDSPVLRGVDLQIDTGELVAIMGPSGSGKTTLLHVLSGLSQPSSGSVQLGETALGGLSERALASLRLTQLGFVFQQPHLMASLNLLDNVVLPGLLAKVKPRNQVVRRAAELLAALGVSGLQDRGVTEASGGQLQRVGIARALINEPKILFADEPTGALNSSAAAQILDILTELNSQGSTIVLVTHDPVVAARAQRVLLLIDGRLCADRQLGDWSERHHGARVSQVGQLLTSFGV